MPTSDSFWHGGGGECGDFKSYCLWLSCFYAVMKPWGDISILLCKRKQLVWRTKKCFKDLHWQTLSPGLVSSECYVELFHGMDTSLLSVYSKSGIVLNWVRAVVLCPEGKNRNVPLSMGIRNAERCSDGGNTLSPLLFPYFLTNLIFQLVNLIPLNCCFYFSHWDGKWFGDSPGFTT